MRGIRHLLQMRKILNLEEQENGSYIFHYAGFTDTVSKEDVESGMYEDYPIIKYNKK